MRKPSTGPVRNRNLQSYSPTRRTGFCFCVTFEQLAVGFWVLFMEKRDWPDLFMSDVLHAHSGPSCRDMTSHSKSATTATVMCCWAAGSRDPQLCPQHRESVATSNIPSLAGKGRIARALGIALPGSSGMSWTGEMLEVLGVQEFTRLFMQNKPWSHPEASVLRRACRDLMVWMRHVVFLSSELSGSGACLLKAATRHGRLQRASSTAKRQLQGSKQTTLPQTCNYTVSTKLDCSMVACAHACMPKHLEQDQDCSEIAALAAGSILHRALAH